MSWLQIGAAPFFNTLDQDASGGLSLEECASALLAAGDYLSADRTPSRFQRESSKKSQYGFWGDHPECAYFGDLLFASMLFVSAPPSHVCVCLCVFVCVCVRVCVCVCSSQVVRTRLHSISAGLVLAKQEVSKSCCICSGEHAQIICYARKGD